MEFPKFLYIHVWLDFLFSERSIYGKVGIFQ